MKKIKFIPILLVALSIIVSSCAIDDDDPVIGAEIITKTVYFDGTQIIIPTSDTPYDVEVLIDQAFGSDALVEYTINSADAGATVQTGNTVGKISVDASKETAYTITLTDVTVLNKPNFVKAVIDEGKKTFQVFVLDYVLPDPDEDSLQIILAWDNPDGNDLDLWITDDPPAIAYATSQSVSAYEDVAVTHDLPDGTYNILVRDWASVDPVVSVMVMLVHPDGTIEGFADSIDAGTDYNYFVKYEKVGSTYTATQVPTGPVF